MPSLYHHIPDATEGPDDQHRHDGGATSAVRRPMAEAASRAGDITIAGRTLHAGGLGAGRHGGAGPDQVAGGERADKGSSGGSAPGKLDDELPRGSSMCSHDCFVRGAQAADAPVVVAARSVLPTTGRAAPHEVLAPRLSRPHRCAAKCLPSPAGLTGLRFNGLRRGGGDRMLVDRADAFLDFWSQQSHNDLAGPRAARRLMPNDGKTGAPMSRLLTKWASGAG